ncbi:MAG: YIP1 family protein [Treponema sp.]|jgi:hypothetical protein|nr:YIP1 family protein [Treponema sp.]
MSAKMFEPAGRGGLLNSLRYSLYVCVHPLDGFWDLTHEKRGSLGAAHIIVAATVAVQIFKTTMTSFLFWSFHAEYFNAAMMGLQVIVPLLLWTVANWSLTTLMDGKGHLREIYMATSYALTPYCLITAAMVLFSRIITIEEGAVYQVFNTFAVVWTAVLIMAAMMMIHDYSPGKMLFSSFLSIVGMGVMLFIFLIFFMLISDCFAYVVSVVKEILYRMD